ncbi:MAG: hypothetical protein FWE32_05830 [Oscillospiraceae bacterium]|nr:hypothetical protein [Oscillospiraceae bacterium]
MENKVENKTVDRRPEQLAHRAGRSINFAQVTLTAVITALVTTAAVLLVFLGAGVIDLGNGGRLITSGEELTPNIIGLSGGTVRVTGEQKFFFTPETTGIWELRTSENFDSDPLLRLINEHGHFMDENDDGGDGLNALIRQMLTAGETYTIQAGFFGSGTGSYTLTVSMPDLETLLPGGEIPVEGRTTLRFTPTHTGFWRLTATSLQERDFPSFRITDEDGNFIGWGGAMGGNNNIMMATVLLTAGQTYLVQVEFGGPNSGGTVRSMPVEPEPFPADRQARVFTDTVFAFTPDRSGLWLIETADRFDSDPALVLTDAEHGKLIEDDDSAGDLNARILFYLEEGQTYFIHARFVWGDGSGSYLLSVTPDEQRPEPALNAGERPPADGGFFSPPPEQSPPNVNFNPGTAESPDGFDEVPAVIPDDHPVVEEAEPPVVG